MQPQTLVFFGIVGSGKGTQVELLADYLKKRDNQEVVYAGTGEGFRQIVESGSYAGELLKEKMERGELIDDIFANSIITNILINSLSDTNHLIVDGYPRTVAQSESLERKMKFFKRDDVKIIHIELSREEAMKRNLRRGRSDDTKEGLERRFQEYENNVVPAMKYFESKPGYIIYTINGEQPVEKVHADIIGAIYP